MIKIQAQQFIWDKWNVDHIARHDVKVHEVETALKDKNTVYYPTYNDRVLMLARSD